MDPFRNGTDKKRLRTHIFVFFSTCTRSPCFRYRSVLFFSEKKKTAQKKRKKRITIPMTRRSSLSTVKCNTRTVNKRTVSFVFLLIWYIISEALLWRIARAVKREFRVLFFRTNQKSACKPASMIVRDTHSLYTVCVSAYEQRIEAVLFNYRGLYRLPVSKKTTCKQSSTRSKGLSSTVPFSVGHITEYVRVNRRFRLEPVLVSNRAVPSLLRCKRALRHSPFVSERHRSEDLHKWYAKMAVNLNVSKYFSSITLCSKQFYSRTFS